MASFIPQPMQSESLYHARKHEQHPCSSFALPNQQLQQLRQGAVSRQQEYSSTTPSQSDWMEYRLLDDILAETYHVEQLSDASHTTSISPFNAAAPASPHYRRASDPYSHVPAADRSLCPKADMTRYGSQLPYTCSPLLTLSHSQQQQQQATFVTPPFADVFTQGAQPALLWPQSYAADNMSRSSLLGQQDKARCEQSAHAAAGSSYQLPSTQQSSLQHQWMAAETTAAVMPAGAARQLAEWGTMALPDSSRTAAAATAAASITMETIPHALPFGTSFCTAQMGTGTAYRPSAVCDLARSPTYNSAAGMTAAAAAVLADYEQKAAAEAAATAGSFNSAGCRSKGSTDTQVGAVCCDTAAVGSTGRVPTAAAATTAPLTVLIPEFEAAAAGLATPAALASSSPARRPPMSAQVKSSPPRRRNNSSPGSSGGGRTPGKICKKERNSHYQRICRERQQKELMDLKSQVANLTSQNSEHRQRVQNLLKSQTQLLDRLRDLTAKWQASIASNDALRRENADFQQQIMAYQQRMLRHSL